MRKCEWAGADGSRPVLWISATLGIFAALVLLAPDAVSLLHPSSEAMVALSRTDAPTSPTPLLLRAFSFSPTPSPPPLPPPLPPPPMPAPLPAAMYSRTPSLSLQLSLPLPPPLNSPSPSPSPSPVSPATPAPRHQPPPASTPDARPLAARLNERFARDIVAAHASPLSVGVLIHHFDGFQNPEQPWAPCAAASTASRCRLPRVVSRRERVSASLIYARLHERNRRIPTFSLDGGVVLRPEYTVPLCGYGADGSIDDNKVLGCRSPAPGEFTSRHARRASAACVPGCSSQPSEPPDWCSRTHVHDEGSWLTCGLKWGRNGVRPWRPAEFGGAGGLMDLFAREGAPFDSWDGFSGYNEIVVSSAAWLRHLPDSVEAIFTVDCHDGDRNTKYTVDRGSADGGTAGSCREARSRARAAHRQFLEFFGVGARSSPLIELRTTNWREPFAAIQD